MPTVLDVVGRIQTLVASKWCWDIRHLAVAIDCSVDEVNCFFKCVENGGVGTKADDTWKANPAPYNGKVDLKGKEDNIINLHYTDHGRRADPNELILEPSPSVIEKGSRFIRLGKISGQNREITLAVQRDIARYVIGTHKTLVRHYPEWAKFRQENWRKWHPILGSISPETNPHLQRL